MRKFLVVVAIMALAVPMMADEPIDPSKEYEMRMMGIEKDQEFTFPEGVESDTFSGSLTMLPAVTVALPW